LLLARQLLSCAPALERMSLSVVVSNLTFVGDKMTEKEIAAKEWTLKECLKKTWCQTDARERRMI
jgi:phosphopantetheinyl transferase (holo-ACP synthase)